jgi:hypothetical protein
LTSARRKGQNPSLRLGVESRLTVFVVEAERSGLAGLRELPQVQLVGDGVGEIDL